MDGFGEVPRAQLAILDHLGIPITRVCGTMNLPDADLMVDALVGYSLSGPPRDAVASLIRAANDRECPMLPLDVDAGPGEVYDPLIVADTTMPLALPKTGLRSPDAQAAVGEIYVANVSVRPELYTEPSIGVRGCSPFALADIVRFS